LCCRGGDFFRRQAAGDHPKQLNYSRAFGGKDLKPYGLSAVPDISHYEITPDDKLVLLGSDGLWDVINPRVACEIALRARAEGRSASQDLVKYAKEEMPLCGVRDNVSCIAIFLNQGPHDTNGRSHTISNHHVKGHQNGNKGAHSVSAGP
jgi:protein phosphatase